MLSQFLVMPAVAYAFASWLDLSNVVSLSIVLVGCTPGGSTSQMYTYLANGNVALSIAMTLISNVLAIGLMPALLELYKGDFTSEDIDVPVGDILSSFGLVLVPVTIGIFVKSKSDSIAWYCEKFGSLFGIFFIVVAVLYGSFSESHIFNQGWELWFAAIFVNLIASFFGFSLAKLAGMPSDETRTVAFETGVQNTTLTLTVIGLAFAVPDDLEGQEKEDAQALLDEARMFPLLYSLWILANGFLLTVVFRYMYKSEVMEGQLEREESQAKTMLILDAFKGDSFDSAAGGAGGRGKITVNVGNSQHPGENHVEKLLRDGNFHAWKAFALTSPEDGLYSVLMWVATVSTFILGICVVWTRPDEDMGRHTKFILTAMFAAVPGYWYYYSKQQIRKALPPLPQRSYIAYPPSKGEGAVRRNILRKSLMTTVAAGVTTIPELFARSVHNHADRPCVGKRPLRRAEMGTAKGRPMLKKDQGDYEFITYAQAYERILNIGSGLVNVAGVAKGNNVAIYADTKMEWQLSAQACFAHNFPVVTVYATLGLPALAHAISETDSSHVIADVHLLGHLADVMEGVELQDGDEVHNINVSNLKHVVVIGLSGATDKQKEAAERLKNRAAEFGGPIAIYDLDVVEQEGAKSRVAVADYAPTSEDMAVIMYTSGSTGLPKGVMMSHKNLLAGVSGLSVAVWGYGPHDAYLAYLPLAHVLELAAENVAFAVGARVGYGTPFTLTDASPGTMEGTQGDAPALRPTLLAAVPKVMDVIRSNILNKVNQGDSFKAWMFNKGFKAKQAALSVGQDVPFWNRLVFDKVRARILGGRVRLMVSGGGPLSPATQLFMNAVFCCPVGQGYGLTETVGAGTVTAPDDFTVGRVGAPVACTQIKLIDWEEGGYRTTDKPKSRGEVLIGGPNITMGYFKQPAKTEETFFTDEHGVRWMRTGDIGQWHEDGCLEIIDRRKDLVKLKHGEYVSYGKVESTLRRTDIIENICVHAEPLEANCIALVLPDRDVLTAWAKASGNANADNWEALCADDAANAEVMTRLRAMAAEGKLQRFEIPAKIELLPVEWTPENDMVTAALKLKRHNIYKSATGSAAIRKLYGRA